jgi:hypothetical protein
MPRVGVQRVVRIPKTDRPQSFPWFPPAPAAELARPASLIAFAVEAEEEDEKRGQRDEEENRSDDEAPNDRIGERKRGYRR